MENKVGVEQADMAAQVLNDAVAQVAATPGLSSRQYMGIVTKAAAQLGKAAGKQLAQKKKVGRPDRYTKKLGEEIVRRIAAGETLRTICSELKIEFGAVMEWVGKYPDEFGQPYKRARESMAMHLVEGMIENVAVLDNDRALAARVQADVVRWVAQRFSPGQFADSKKVELSGEIQHTHIHQLEDHQKRKIAEAWLMSQQDDSPGITAETSGPDLESVAVREICEGEQGVIPKRKRSTQPKLPDPKAKRGRKPKVDMDKPIDSDA